MSPCSLSAKLRRPLQILGAIALLALPMCLVTSWTVGPAPVTGGLLSMREAYQVALDAVKQVCPAGQLHTVTSVDEDRPPDQDGASGRLPHWNVDLVAPNNDLYRVEIRAGKPVRATKDGTAPYTETLARSVVFIDSPELARLALTRGLRPYQGKWARGMNFVLTSTSGGHATSVRGASQNGLPAMLTYDSVGGTLLASIERSFVGGGLYAVDVHPVEAGAPVQVAAPRQLLPQEGQIPDDIAVLAVAQGADGQLLAIYAGTDSRRDAACTERARLLVSLDRGATWQDVDGPYTAADAILQIAAAPGGSTLFVATTDGLFVADLSQGPMPLSWRQPDKGLPEGQVTGLALSPSYAQDQMLWAAIGLPTTRSSLWAVPGSQGLFRSQDGGRTWTELQAAPVNVLTVAASPSYSADHTIFAISAKVGVYKTTNGGEDWLLLPLQGPGLYGIAISPAYASDRTVFAATDKGVARSTDGGETWTMPGGDAARTQMPTLSVTLSPSFADDHTLVRAVFRRGLAISRDRGETWQELSRLGAGDPTPRGLSFLDASTLAASAYSLPSWKPF